MILSGTISVKAALQQQKREVKEIFFLDGRYSRDLSYIRALAAQAGVPCHYVSREELDCLSGMKEHGGIVAEAGERIPEDPESLNGEAIFFLDGIEDPFNLGYCLRTLCAFGFEDVLGSERQFGESEAVILRSSAGAYERVRYAQCADPASFLKRKKAEGYRLLALQRSPQSVSLFEADLEGKFIFLIGGERRGIRKELLALCDQEIVIPYGSDFRNALNASSALAVAAAEVFRRRKK